MPNESQIAAPSGDGSTARVSPAYMLVQSLLIHFMAKAKIPTNEIAAKLNINRSYVIRLAEVSLAARTPREQALLALARGEYEGNFQRMGLKGLLADTTLTTTLAGGERPKLGPLADRRAAKAAQTAPAARLQPVSEFPTGPSISVADPNRAPRGRRARQSPTEPFQATPTPAEPQPRLSAAPSGPKRGAKAGTTTVDPALEPVTPTKRALRAAELGGAPPCSATRSKPTASVEADVAPTTQAPSRGRKKADAQANGHGNGAGHAPVSEPKGKRRASPSGVRSAPAQQVQATADDLFDDQDAV